MDAPGRHRCCTAFVSCSCRQSHQGSQQIILNSAVIDHTIGHVPGAFSMSGSFGTRSGSSTAAGFFQPWEQTRPTHRTKWLAQPRTKERDGAVPSSYDLTVARAAALQGARPSIFSLIVSPRKAHKPDTACFNGQHPQAIQHRFGDRLGPGPFCTRGRLLTIATRHEGHVVR